MAGIPVPTAVAALLVGSLLLALPAAGGAALNGPPLPVSARVQTPEHETSSVKLVFLGAIRLFQELISPIDGPRCGFSPSCSAFGHQAVRQYGPVRGVLLTADRLLRCTPFTTPGTDYLVLPNGRLFDPVSANLLGDR